MWYANSCRGTVTTTGESSSGVAGTSRTWSAIAPICCVALRRDRDHLRAAGAHLLDVGEHLRVHVAFRGDRHDRHAVLDQRDRAVLQLAGREPLRVDVAELLELQRALERGRVARVPPDEQDVARVRVTARPALGTAPSRSIARCDLLRQLVHPLQDLGDLLREHRAAHLRQVERHQVLRHHLRRERLRAGHRDLGTGVRVQDAVGLARERRSDRVRHRDHVRPLASRVPGRLERVDRLARLAHRQRQRVGAEHRIAVAELARDLDLDGQARPVLDRVLRHEPGVERRPARDHEDLVDLAQDVVGDPQLVHHQSAVHDAARRACRGSRPAARGSPSA